MKIPFGDKLPEGECLENLLLIGFKLNEIQKIKNLYYLTLPSSQQITCEYNWKNKRYDRSLIAADFHYTIYLNKIPIINVIQKIRDKETTCTQKLISFFQSQERSLKFNINEENLNQALNHNMVEEKFIAGNINESDTPSALKDQLREVVFGTVLDGEDHGVNIINLLIQCFPQLLADIKTLVNEDSSLLKKYPQFRHLIPTEAQEKIYENNNIIFRQNENTEFISCRIS